MLDGPFKGPIVGLRRVPYLGITKREKKKEAVVVRALLVFAVSAILVSPALAAPNLYDDFENGVGGDIVYAPWGNVSGDSTSPNGINNLIATSSSHNHTPGGSQSARVWASDPAAWNGYTDFGATAGAVRAEVYVFEDLGNGTPATNMLSLYGDSGTNNPGAFTDYMQVGVVPFYPAGSAGYGWRTASGGVNNASPATARKAGWTKLAIEADALSTGGQVRFYIDDALVGTSVRAAGVNLRWVRLGNNSKSLENFWYDDLKVTPEPASLLMLVLGSCLVLRRRTA
jgi:hypothetical protein